MSQADVPFENESAEVQLRVLLKMFIADGVDILNRPPDAHPMPEAWRGHLKPRQLSAYTHERCVRALKLRRDGLTLKQVGAELGCGAERARILIMMGKAREPS